MKKKLFLASVMALTALTARLSAARPERVVRDVMARVHVVNRERTPVPLERRMGELNVPAVSIAFFEGDQVTWAKAFGLADVENNHQATTETLFQAASISKPVTATAVLGLVEDGVLELDADVNAQLSAWRLRSVGDRIQQRVTLFDLLGHAAGVTVPGFPGYGPDDAVPSLLEILDGKGKSARVVVAHEPGAKYAYSGGGYIVIQQLVVEATQQPFELVLDERVLKPLGMTSSTFEQPLPQGRRAVAATGYRSDLTPLPGRYFTYPEQSPAGLWSTPTDLARWAMAIQAAFAGRDQRLLERATAKKMLRPHPVSQVCGLGPGLPHGGSYFSHGGENEGFECHLTAQTNGRQGLVVMTNSDRGSILAQEVLLTFADEYGWPEYRPIQKRVVELTPQQRKRLCGSYRVLERPRLVVDIVSEQMNLAAVRRWDNVKIPLLPESETEFFEPEAGASFVFDVTDGNAISFKASGLTFTSVSD